MSKRQAEDITEGPSSVAKQKGSDNKRSKKAHGGKKRKEKKNNNNLDENGWDLRKTGWKNLVLDSERFTSYYKAQGIISEEEWDVFMNCLRTPLPTSFRITQVRLMAEEVKKKISAFQDMKITTDDGSSIDPPKPIAWYPNNMGWRYTPNRNQLKKYPQFEEFHKFLNFQGESGNISRQEEVSMIPPFLLKVEPHHKVLDMCAAPGSKTSQLIEFLHANNNSSNNNNNSPNSDEPPAGLVVANDADETRCYTLTHQIKRLCSPNVIITNHFAQVWPFIKVPPSAVDPSISPNTSQAELAQKFEGLNREGKVLYQFDRILCDVPCSGDGTLRKNQNLWQKWHISMGNGLHKLQYQIAKRGVHLLKVGGRIVYSTCSLNPVENEAVVAELLRSFKGCIELEDISGELPALKRRQGITSWKVSDKTGKLYQTFQEVTSNTQLPGDQRKKILKSMFPPTQEEIASFNLNRCIRIVPHDSDTGGFFIAVFRKLAPTHSRDPEAATEENEQKEAVKNEEPKNEEMAAPEDVADVVEGQMPSLADEKNRNSKKRKSGEAPFLTFPRDLMPQFEEVRKFYGVSENFPMSRLMIRSEKSLKIYYVSPSVRDLLLFDEKGVLRIVNTGIKTLERGDKKDNSPCKFRLTQEGMDLIYPYLSKRIVLITEADLLVSLREKDPFFYLYSDRAKKTLEGMEIGSFSMVVDPESDSKWAGLRLACWRGKTSCHLLVSKLEVTALLQLAGTAEDVKAMAKAESDKKKEDKEKKDNKAEKKDEGTTQASS